MARSWSTPRGPRPVSLHPPESPAYMNRFCRTFSSSRASLQGAKPKWGDRKAQAGTADIEKLQKNVRLGATTTVPPKFWPNLGQTSTYEPTDFSFKRITSPKRYEDRTKKTDRFIAHNINPLDHWKNASLLSHFITANGKIIPGHEHGNKGSTQRKLAKAIRRCRAAGLLSTVHQDVSKLPVFNRYR